MYSTVCTVQYVPMLVIVESETPIHAFLFPMAMSFETSIKYRPCVLINKTMKSNVAPRKVFLFQMYFVSQVPWIKQSLYLEMKDATVYRRWCCFAHYKAVIWTYSSLREQDMTCPCGASFSCPSTKNETG